MTTMNDEVAHRRLWSAVLQLAVEDLASEEHNRRAWSWLNTPRAARIAEALGVDLPAGLSRWRVRGLREMQRQEATGPRLVWR